MGTRVSAHVHARAPAHARARPRARTRTIAEARAAATQDSLGGTAKTLMFVNCSPAGSNHEESLMSLKWAQRAGQVAPIIVCAHLIDTSRI